MIEQAFIAVTELIAIWLVQDKRDEFRKWACIFGLLGQPFWMYSSYQANQWGAFVLCFFFTAAWLKSVKQYWLIPKADQGMTSQDYFQLITEALNKSEKASKLDQKDYIKRVLKEALKLDN
jgi:hypothetical protein